ncbi:MAG: VCBS repeat-containing protein, partial [Candidatus Eisenbacteria bacterium]|nr:VCBS repeat-containing protein [Candidatus Eisenbacteria bacterium]
PKTYVPSGTQCDTVALDGADISETAIALMTPNMHVSKLYENYFCFPGSLRETKQRVIDSLNVGYGLAMHLGHGYRNTMSVADATLGNSDADLLVNGTRAGVLMGENCTSAAFDFNCIGERFVLNENGGSVCYMGSTRFDYPTTAWIFQDEKFRLIFQEGITSMGEALGLSKAAYIALSIADDSYRWTQFVQVLFGDPHMPMWTAEPAALDVTHAAQFEAGSDWYQVLVTSGGSPVDSALVCLWKTGEDYRIAYTNSDGTAVMPFSPNTQGSFSVTATKQNHLPYEGTAQVVLPSAPFLYKYTDDVDDDTLGLSFGNGDYTADAGETIELTITLRNNGGTTATSVTATIRTEDPYLTFTDSTASFGNIAPSSFAPQDAPYVVEVARGCPDVHDALCTIEARDDQDSVWTDALLIRVHAPRLWHASHVYFDTLASGNGDGYIEVGEEIELVLTLKNMGAGGANRVWGKLTSANAYSTVYDSLAAFGSIEACSSSTGDRFMFVCTGEMEPPAFHLTLTDTLGWEEVTTFDLLAPAGPTGIFATGNSSSVKLTWNVSGASDLFGYNVYRSMASAGPYAKVNEAVIEGTSYYMDDGLLPYTRYYYMVSCQDSSANESMSSTYVSVTTNPPLHENSPFELGSELTSSSPAIVDIDKNGQMEIFAGSSRMYAFRPNGDEYIDGDDDLLTWGVFAPEGEKFVAAPAVADIDNDNDVEVVAVDWNTMKVYVWGPDGTVEPGWPQNVGINPWSTPAVGNIAGDGRLEVVVGNADGNIYAWNCDGTEVVDGDGNPATLGVLRTTGSSWLYGSAALVDLDNDGFDEVVIGGRDGKLYALNGDGSDIPHFPYVTTGYITCSPAVGDVDGDGQPEIAFASSNYKVYVINTDSTLVPGWPKSGINMSGDMQPSPALGDVDDDGMLDVVVGTSNGYVCVYKGYNGATVPGWPVLASALGSQSSPTVGDIDGDDRLEVLFGAENGMLYAWNHDGTEAAGFPIQMTGEVRGPALIWDVDDDGYTNIVCQNWDRAVYIWDMTGPFSYSREAYPWPMFRHDMCRSGLYTKAVLTAVELSSFAAVPSEVGVVLEWRTNLDDAPGAQWNVYRKDVTDERGAPASAGDTALMAGLLPDGYAKVNSAPVEAAGPNYYVFTDMSVEGGRWYSYVLGRLLEDGEMLFGPYAALAPAGSVPTAPALAQNFPNPFQPRTTVAFTVPVGAGEAGARTPVSVRVYDVSGRLVKTLVDERKGPGFYSVRWDATSEEGGRVAGGIYFIRAHIGDYSATRKTVVLD